MIRSLLFVTLLLLPVSAFTQLPTVLTDSASVHVSAYELAPDRNYTFEQILTDTSIQFVANDLLQPHQATQYWLKLTITNPFDYAEPYHLIVEPDVNNTLYYVDASTKKWISTQAGAQLQERVRGWGRLPCSLPAKTVSTLYVKVSIDGFSQADHTFKPTILLRKEIISLQRDQTVWMAWVIGLLVVVLFFLNNLYVYVSFKDKAVFYYLIIQLGGMIYLTGHWGYFSVLFSTPVFNFSLHTDGGLHLGHTVHYYNLNVLLMHAGIGFILFGFVQLTRSYLNTAQSLPKLDRLLRYGLCGYLALSVIVAGINIVLFDLEYYTLAYDNLYVLFLIGLTLATCLTGYRRKLPAATPFLLANLFPLVFVLAIPLFHLLISYTSTDNLWLPDLAVIAQALGFSIAIVARTKSIQQALNAEAIKSQQLTADLRESELCQQLTEAEKQKISANIQLLEQNLESNQRELAATTLHMVQKNELLAELQEQVEKLAKLNPSLKPKGLHTIEAILKNNLYVDKDWGKFKLHFEQVHPHFFDNLQASHPQLTSYEIRLYAYLHLNLSTKEIAALLNIDPASVRRAKTRLTKKMALSPSLHVVDLDN
ncbi:hypothetical protein IC229_06360 [Spirosoma sp. BT702]|uniref:7TM-DISM receptor extracellular domain-containing protein n=1 Tax=Spirosoma profusum TaxID=2771354 RepID=A0A926XTS8_9BACT|nr:7TM-DISM domain-containing protein [Spirosoma profusum]MBD2700249.1 hypothetical protein [Spirosoma profusum]